MDLAEFKRTIQQYYKTHKRILPWRIMTEATASKKEAYKILVSEFMLQQTQVVRVVPKFEEFLKQFPTMESLAHAPQKDVLLMWQGLGYNRRALYLKKTAELIVEKHKGFVPADPVVLESFPGIGPYTARALSVFISNKPEVFIETNIRSVYIHLLFPERGSVSDKELISFIEATVDVKSPRQWYYALMDYGSMIKKTVGNPNIKSKHYVKQSQFKGSKRESRSLILKMILSKGSVSKKELIENLQYLNYDIPSLIEELLKEGFIERKGSRIYPR